MRESERKSIVWLVRKLNEKVQPDKTTPFLCFKNTKFLSLSFDLFFISLFFIFLFPFLYSSKTHIDLKLSLNL